MLVQTPFVYITNLRDENLVRLKLQKCNIMFGECQKLMMRNKWAVWENAVPKIRVKEISMMLESC